MSADQRRSETVVSLDLPVIAGALSSVLFALGTLPMLVKAVRTKDLSSYSVGNIALSNIANVIYSVYVLHLPPGPVWALHGFHLLSTGLMLIWYVRYSSARRRSPRPPQRPAPTQNELDPVGRAGRLRA